MYKYIVTHPGKAHQDDFLACALLVRKYDIPVLRREPTDAELNDKGIIVVDVGGRYEPEFSNFDHHHDASLPCALHLIGEYFSKDMRKVFSWWDAVDYQDRNGVQALFNNLGLVTEWDDPDTMERGTKSVSHEIFEQLNSPISAAVLAIFSKMDRILPVEKIPYESTDGDWFHNLLSQIGDGLLEQVVLFQGGWDNMRHEGPAAISDVLINPAKFKYAREHGCTVLVEQNDKGTGFKIVGVDGKGPDFRSIQGRENVIFVHNSGFMCVIDDDMNQYKKYLP